MIQDHVLGGSDAAITSAVETDGDRVKLTLSSDVFLQAVEVSAPGYRPSDNYFHVMPGNSKTIVFRREGDAPFEATLQALNVREALSVRASAAANGREPQPLEKRS